MRESPRIVGAALVAALFSVACRSARRHVVYAGLYTIVGAALVAALFTRHRPISTVTG